MVSWKTEDTPCGKCTHPKSEHRDFSCINVTGPWHCICYKWVPPHSVPPEALEVANDVVE